MAGRIAALFLLAIVGTFQADRAGAQPETLYLQLEAHMTEALATDMIAGYLDDFDNVVGYRLRSSGWHVIALGPFDSREAANELRRNLLAARRIPPDAFVNSSANYTARYWPPEGAVTASVAAEAQPAEDAAQREAAAAEAAEREAARLAAAEAVRIEAERLAAEEAARIAAEEAARIAALRDESPAEARRSEAQLSREERAEIQTALQWKGYYTLAIDADFGPGTRRSMEAWQRDRGVDPTGVLTSRQRAVLLEEYRSEKAAIGLANWRDDTAGIAVDLPLGMVAFARYEAPFVHFDEIGDSGVRMLLISQPGNLATLFGLYEIMQTLEIVPLEGERERRRNSFLLTGRNDVLRSHTFAQQASGQVKGYTLIWTPENDTLMERVLPAVEASFVTFGGTLPEGTGVSAAGVTGGDLLAGLEIRRPSAARTGFYVDATGSVLTSADLVAGCGRITIDEAHEAQIAYLDPDLGIAVLRPTRPLAPLAFANFHLTDPAPRSEVRVAGFSFEDLLTRPTLAIGQLAALQGLNGEAELRRLTVPAMPGDAGGPVFDATGSVIGMLLPAPSGGARLLPDDVHLAVAGATLHSRLQAQGIAPANLPRAEAMPDETLMRAAADMTVLVSCWN